MAPFVIPSVEEGTGNYLSSLREPQSLEFFSENGNKESCPETKRAREDRERKEPHFACVCARFNIVDLNLGGN